jgi:anti-anti-sigma factor
VVLHLRGEIDMATGPLLDEQLGRAVTAATPPAPVVVDLSEVQHLGSVGVALLTACHRRCDALGIPMLIVAGDGHRQHPVVDPVPLENRIRSLTWAFSVFRLLARIR